MQTDINSEEILEALRKGALPADTTFGEIRETVLDMVSGSDPEKAERGLLALYYLWKGAAGFEGAESGELRERLDTCCAEASEEPLEAARGRKLWILVKLAFADGRHDDIRELLAALGGSETSAHVWERLLRAIGSEDEGFRFYPDPLASLPALRSAEVEYWGDFVHEQEGYIRYALTASDTIRENMEAAVGALSAGSVDSESLYSIIRGFGAAGSAFPLDSGAFAAIYHRAAPEGRLRLFTLLSRYLCALAEDSGRVDSRERAAATAGRMRFAFDTAPLFDTPAGKRLALFERSSSLALALIASEESAFGRSIDFLCRGIDRELRTPELLHDLRDTLGGHLLRMIREQSAPAGDAPRCAALLSDESAYLQQLGATLLLQAARSGCDISSVTGEMARALAADPSTSNSLASGKDIEPEEGSFSCTLPSIKAFGLSADEEVSGEEDGFMNLRSLTGLLEMCQPPTTAVRLGLALELTGKPEKPEKTAAQKPARRAPPEVTGPMALGEAVELITAAGGDMECLRELAAEKEEQLSRRYGTLLSERRRGMIRSVFEGGFAETPGLYPESREKIEAEGGLWPGPFEPAGAEESFDWLAWYLPALPLPESRRAYSGVYFRASRILSFAGARNLPMEDLLQLIAVHELFHAFCEQRTGQVHSHEGEHPEYCRLEEAGANRAAFDWGNNRLGADRLAPFLSSLLLDSASDPARALPGYGEYHLLDAETPGWLPLMLGEGAGHIQPPEYAHRRLIASTEHRREYETSRIVWNGMVEAMNEEQICWFVDTR